MRRSAVFTVVAVAAGVALGAAGYSYYKQYAVTRSLSAGAEAYARGDLAGAQRIYDSLLAAGARGEGEARDAAVLGRARIAGAQDAPQDMLRYWGEALAGGQLTGDAADEALYEMARAHALAGDVAAGRASVAALLAQNPDGPYADDARLLDARLAVKEGRLLEARATLRDIIERYPNTELMASVVAALGDVNVQTLFSRNITEDDTKYMIQPGDSMAAIAQRSGIPLELLLRANGMKDGSSIKVNETVKIPGAAFSLLIDKGKNTLTVYRSNVFFKQYRVGTGQQNSTPVGEFTVISKLKEPVWYKPGGGVIPFGDPANLLGTRWIGINSPGYGIHGTWDDTTIGRQSSAGCIRLKNSDVEELYDMLPMATTVRIVD